jgi:GDPmannose 4,6-dehydratase
MQTRRGVRRFGSRWRVRSRGNLGRVLFTSPKGPRLIRLNATVPKRALITGVSGQDGSYLAELLLHKGYEVHGLVRGSTEQRFERLDGFQDRLVLHEADLLDERSLLGVMRASEPHEVYNLAAMSSVSESWNLAVATAEYTAVGVTRLLEAIRETCPDARFYQASSSEMFGHTHESPQGERTAFYPRSPYGVAKVYGHFITVNYRESFGLHACSGILFNHESPRRGKAFVTRRITQGAASIKLGLADELTLGNLDARRDWGFAKEYVEAMWLMLQRDDPEDFVIGTGISHSVRDVVAAAFDCVGLDWEDYVRVETSLARPADIEEVVADPSKAREGLGWKAEVGFEELIQMMVEADVTALSTPR